MIERKISLISTGAVRTAGGDSQLRLGYSRNRGVYRLNIDPTGEWEGLTIRAMWHTGEGKLYSSLVKDGKIDVPAVVTSEPGGGKLVFEGSDGARTLTSGDIRYSVAMNSGTCGDMPEANVPAWQQLVAMVTQATGEAWQAGEDARRSAAEARQALTEVVGAKDTVVKEVRKAETDAINHVDEKATEARDNAVAAVARAGTEARDAADPKVHNDNTLCHIRSSVRIR